MVHFQHVILYFIYFIIEVNIHLLIVMKVSVHLLIVMRVNIHVLIVMIVKNTVINSYDS